PLPDPRDRLVHRCAQLVAGDDVRVHGQPPDRADEPTSPHLGAPDITAELYFGHADNDRSLPPEQIERFEEALTAAGVRHTCEVYQGAPHGYTQADTPAYDREADERHWAALLDLLKRTF
ncbi:dienelactone hydrolase family protein, partial [Streptomyces sp. NPDC003233]